MLCLDVHRDGVKILIKARLGVLDDSVLIIESRPLDKKARIADLNTQLLADVPIIDNADGVGFVNQARINIA